MEKLTSKELQKRISLFQSLDIDSMSEAHLTEELFNVFSIRDDAGNYVMPRQFVTIYLPPRSIFYRTRIISSLDEMKTEQDFWNNPCPPIGRLNAPDEPALYLCHNYNPLHTAIAESSIGNNNMFAICSFSSNQEIALSSIGVKYDPQTTSEDEQRVFEITNRFLENEFSRKVSSGKEYHYRKTLLIGKMYGFGYNLEEIKSDGMIYPSVETKAFNNICLDAFKARNKLDLLGAVVCIKKSEKELDVFKVLKREADMTKSYDITVDLLNEILPDYKEIRYGLH